MNFFWFSNDDFMGTLVGTIIPEDIENFYNTLEYTLEIEYEENTNT